MVNYKNGKIYTLRSNQIDKIYIGSSCMKLCDRLKSHRHSLKKYIKNNKNNLMWYSAFDMLIFDDCYIELLEDYPCDNREQLLKREGELIRQTPNCINKRVAGRTPKQYYYENNELILKKMKTYRENNKEKISIRRKKAYYANHEKMLKKKKEYRAKNREVLNRKKKVKIKCVACNCMVSKSHIARHNKSPKHLNNLEGIKPEKKTSYYLRNKKKVADKKKIKVYCETCKCMVSKSNLSYHRKTKKHLNITNV